ncbi:MAG: putative mucin/carbohydrate-binding domain-containing protein, partial [Sarcina sp.]
MTDKKLRVSTSSFPMGKLSDNADLPYFIFILKDSSGTEKTIARILQNSQPDDFTAALNEYSFEYGDSINMQSVTLNKIVIMNYAKYENDYSPKTNYEEFTITKLGLVSSLTLLKNEISFLGFGNNLISKIYFDVIENKLLAESTDTTAHTSFKNEYFAIVLKDTSGNIINEASVKGTENANSFADTLNETPFQFGYSITARFAEKDRFLVSNYPTDGTTYKSSNNTPKTFIINKDGLVSPPVKNIITFLGLNNALIATIEFNFSLKQLVVKSTGNPAHLNFPGQEYFTFILKDSHDTLIKEASVKGNENANAFAATLNDTPFQFGYTITARFIHNNRFLISDYPVANDTYNPSNI